MRLSTSYVSLLAVVAHGPSVLDAFTAGAGGCMTGRGCNPNITAGTFVQGGFSVGIDEESFPLRAPLEIGRVYNISVQGPDFRGVLIKSNSLGVSMQPTDTLLQPSVPCDGQGYQGITQVDAALKDKVQGEFMCLEAGTHDVGITIVVANNFQEGSIYYSTEFSIDCGENLPVPTEMPVATIVPTNESITGPTVLPFPTVEPTGQMGVTVSPTDNATASDIPFEFNETDKPPLDINETNTPVTDVGQSAPMVTGSTSGVDTTTPSPSSATSTITTLWLSFGAVAAVVVVGTI